MLRSNDRAPGSECRGDPKNVLELADVARPRMPHEGLAGCRRQAFRGVALQEMLGDLDHVAGALALPQALGFEAPAAAPPSAETVWLRIG